jgi:Phospholipase_D-nuclease N-terminal/Short C-terminal domain
MLLATSFWETFFLILIFLPLALIWASALFDVFRRDDIHGVSKALWVAAIILVPFFGTLIYLIARPRGATPEERELIDQAGRREEFAARSASDARAFQLQALADLHARGKLTDEEFAAEKARVLSA